MSTTANGHSRTLYLNRNERGSGAICWPQDGLAFALLQFAVSRTRIQIVLGLSVSAAFIFWGVEQFVPNPFVASSIDDFVVFLFVLDLSLVIYQHLKSTEHAASADLPFVPSSESTETN